MRYIFSIICILMAIILIPVSLGAEELVQHDIKVTLYPEEHRLSVEDRVTVPEDMLNDLKFLLHGGMKPTTTTPGVRIIQESKSEGPVPMESFRVILPSGMKTFVIEYSGKIYHKLKSYGKEYARGFRQTQGMISGDGVYLADSSYWYPRFGDSLMTFKLMVELPGSWNAVSQGGRILNIREGDSAYVSWESYEPQKEIYLVAAPFIEYTQHAGLIDAMVFLRKPDEGLAKKYLDATVQYLEMYEKLIGPYPYMKFALVENFWETGFGMPSFTLLGPKIIRFPFILYSSYPHEILHNWWGNSVFTDYEKGNWAEGLTAYLSDHLIKEQRGNGAEYRQATLQKYVDYVLSGRDFPLTKFHSRHSSPSEAVGYGKSLMFFHMLRQELGDKTFIKGLQDFYSKNRFRTASFEDLRISFEVISEKDMSFAFDQWVKRTGAPKLKVKNAKAMSDGDGYILTAILEQVQHGSPYHLRIPVAVTMEGQDRAFQSVVVMDKRIIELKLHVPERPLRLDVDPEFDIFRRLDREEFPPALTQAFGAKKMIILLPSSVSKSLLKSYRELSESIIHSGPDEVKVLLDKEFERLPSDSAVTIFGWENHFIDKIVPALSGYDVDMTSEGVRIGHTEIKRENHTVVLTARHPGNKELSLTWIATDMPEATPGLGRKLPHYHKYSYLGFEGKEPENIAKGRWQVLDSPMTVFFQSSDGKIENVEMAKLLQREPLEKLPQVFSEKQMIDTVRFLSSEELKGRGCGTEELNIAAEFIARKFKEAGLKPAGDSEGSYFQIWQDKCEGSKHTVIMRNVVGVVPGNMPELKAESVIVGSHYDHLGLGLIYPREEKYRGKIHPGADDNASGVAILLELARVISRNMNPDRSIVFVAFTGEDSGRKGSSFYVANQKLYPPEQIIGMINLDTVGRLGKRKLLILGADSAREWVHIFRGAGYVTGVDVDTVSEELDSSDHISFHKAGVPAVQLFSGPHLDYHRPTDTAEKIDPEGLLKVASVAREAIEYLSGHGASITSVLKTQRDVESVPGLQRKVSLGTVPDFTFKGDGYRLSGVVPDSPAESCGLKEGDVIIRIGSEPVKRLKDLSVILKSLKPGDNISITFIRDGKVMAVETKVVER